MVKKKRRYCGLEMFLLMEKDFKKAMEGYGDIKSINEFVKKWGGAWIED